MLLVRTLRTQHEKRLIQLNEKRDFSLVSERDNANTLKKLISSLSPNENS